jgi:WD repeat-containing protein 55
LCCAVLCRKYIARSEEDADDVCCAVLCRKYLARSEEDADDELLSVCLAKKGSKVVVGTASGVVALWSWGHWPDCSDRYPGHPEAVDCMTSWDDDMVITGCTDGMIRVVQV